MSTRLKYYLAELLEDLEEADCGEITIDLNLDKYGCVDEKGKHHLQTVIKPTGKLKRPKTVSEQMSGVWVKSKADKASQ